MTALQRIRKNTGMSFKDTVKHYAGMGMSRTATAEEIGISLKHFRDMCERFDLHREFRPQSEMVRDCKGGGHGWPKGKKKNSRPRYSDEEILKEVGKYDYSTFRSMADINIVTVWRRFGSWKRAK